MKVLIDTCNADLFLSIVDGDKTISCIYKVDILKKADILHKAYEELLSNANLSTKDILSFYVTIGPGSFMGSRAGLIFAKTIAQSLNKNLYVANNFAFISAFKDGVYFIDAKGNSFYKAFIQSGEIEMSISKTGRPTLVDYRDIILNPKKYLSVFYKEENFLNVKPIYLKEPKIGGE